MITRDGYVGFAISVLQKLYLRPENRIQMQEILGTKDYIAPEYIVQGRIT